MDQLGQMEHTEITLDQMGQKLPKSVWSNIVKAGKCIDELAITFRNSFVRKIGDGTTTSFWIDLWLGNDILKNGFNLLAHLDSDPGVTVGSRIHHNWSEWVGNSDWVRNPSGRAVGELQELNELLMRSNTTLDLQKRDSWGWSLSNNDFFKTKILSDLIDSKVLHSNSSTLCISRNNLVAKKVEVFVWRAKKGRLSVLLELDKRGVDLHSVRCQSCGNDLECIRHALLSCEKVWEVWKRLFDWWGVTLPSNVNLNELLEGNLGQFGSDLGKNLWQGMIWVSVYFIWKNRNEKIFKNKSWNIPVALVEYLEFP
ncbi:uncharacterized protein [Rutidosis leptorrhynchoides]|uniref:uncharacterized protein n=1 Tax=Rutidosis leptorrhynchoides TaxID=125765 RepID=UPI003A98CEFB